FSFLSPHLSLSRHPLPRSLPSFPTRRSSDLFFPTRGGRRAVTRSHPLAGTGRFDPYRQAPGKTCAFRAPFQLPLRGRGRRRGTRDRKSTRLNSSHGSISYAVFCLKKKNKTTGAAERNTTVDAADWRVLGRRENTIWIGPLGAQRTHLGHAAYIIAGNHATWSLAPR